MNGIAFGVDRGTVTLVGYSYEGRLKADAEMATKRASGVDEVSNKIEELPASSNDDRIRWATFYKRLKAAGVRFVLGTDMGGGVSREHDPTPAGARTSRWRAW